MTGECAVRLTFVLPEYTVVVPWHLCPRRLVFSVESGELDSTDEGEDGSAGVRTVALHPSPSPSVRKKKTFVPGLQRRQV